MCGMLMLGLGDFNSSPMAMEGDEDNDQQETMW